MKLRHGFVSNSSSSSFVILDKNDNFTKIHFEGDIIKVPQTFGGETEFARNKQTHRMFGTKLNWAFLQAYYMDNYQSCYGDIVTRNDKPLFEDDWWREHFLSNYRNLITKVKDTLIDGLGLGSDVPIEIYLKDFSSDDNFGIWWNNHFDLKDEECVSAFIDHQSIWTQSPKNLEIFDGNNLKYFLFNPDSYICEDAD
jgi:hypothetical protein